MIVGTAGHIDHGKTSLIRKLTGIDTDRLKEEKARGISIDLGFAYWSRPSGGIIGFVDVPGHEGLVHNMLAGATSIDFVILVVAADDGVMPQTREHLAIMDLLGLKRGLVALNKSDLVSSERLEAVQREVEATLADTALAGAEIIPVSAATGAGFERLTDRIDRAAQLHVERSSQGRFRLSVDRSFALSGLGTTVTGTVISGSVRIGDRLIVSPAGLEARVRSIHAHNRAAQEGCAGQRCALVLSGPQIAKESLRRGDVILDPTLHAPTLRIDARLRVLPSERKPIGQWFPVKVHQGAAEVPGRVVIFRDEPLAAGESDFVQLVLERPIAASAGDRFVIRDTSSTRTIGGGVLIDLRAPDRRRRTPARLARIEALAENDPAIALQRILNEQGAWIALDGFFRDRALGAEAAERIVSSLPIVTFLVKGETVAFSSAAWCALQSAVVEKLRSFHAANPELPGIGIEQLRRVTQSLFPAQLFIAALRKLAEQGSITLDRTWVRLPGHEVRFTLEEERLLVLILRQLTSQPYRPPRVRDIAKAFTVEEAKIRRLLRMAARRGEVEEIAHDHFFTRASVQAMAAIALELANASADGKFNAAAFRDRLDNGRKVAIQVLEFFDRHGFTIRRQDLRRINPARIEFFTPVAPSSKMSNDKIGGVPLPVGRPDFKSGWDRQTVSGGFDSHPPPPSQRVTT